MKAGSFVHLVLMLILAGGLTLGSFSAFSGAQVQSEEGWDMGTLVFDEALESTEASTLIVNERDSLSLLPETGATLSYDEENSRISVNLNRGGVFFATLADDFSVSIVTDFVRIDSQNSSAAVLLSESGDSIEVYALEHPTLVTFIENGEDLNALLVPTGYRIKIPSSKVTSTLQRLRLTKLTKEFPVFAFEESELDAEVLALFDSSQNLYNENSVAFLQEAQKGSHFGPALSGLGSYLHRGYAFFRGTLTVLPHAQADLEEEQKQDYLLYGMTNLLFGDQATGEDWLLQWKNAQPDLEQVDQLYSSLFFTLPGDELYPAKAAAAELLYPNEDPLTALRRQFQEIEGLLDRGALVEAQSAYQDYQEKFETALESGTLDEEEYLDEISREYYLLELLLRSNAVFYSGSSIKLLTELEDKILSLAGSDEDLDEERQAFVQSKLRYLENLFNFVTDLKISVDNATELANELVSQAGKYLDGITSQVAVKEYFVGKLADYDLSIQFMNSPEFYSYDDFDEGLEAYRFKVEDLENLNQYLQDLRSEEEVEATVSLEEATAQVEKDLRSNGIQFSEVVSLGDAANRLFEIQGGRTGGYSFEANYDRETQMFYDMVVNESRFSTGITLENAQTVIKEAMEGLPEIEEPEQVSDVEDDSSLTEDVVLARAKNAFEGAGLDPKDFSFTIIDIEQGTINFEGTATDAQLSVSGTFDLDSQIMSEVTWRYNDSTKTLPNLKIDQFEDALYATYQALSEAGQ